MTTKTFSILCFVAFLFLLSACSGDQAKEADAAKANILFIFADDQTFASIRALGNEEIRTPNLDRLVESGTTFTNAFNMGGWNGAVCLASRAMLNSGRSLWRANRFRKNWEAGDSLDLSWSRLMEKNGYATYMSGKWHVDAPADSIFQTTAHIRPGMPGDTAPGYDRPLSENDWEWTPWDTAFGGFWEGGKHWSEVVKEDAFRFLGAAASSEDPFFMYLAFNAPHDPRQSPKEYVDRYPLDSIALPVNFLPEHPFKAAIGCSESLRDERLAPFPRTEYAVKVHRQEYYAIISHMDAQIGKILDSLEATGEMDNTYVIFTADHGLAVGRHGLMGKQNLYEHSIRVPLIIRGPGIPKGRRVGADVYLQDVMPTTLEISGIRSPDYVDFKSLLSLARGKTREKGYQAIYGAYIDYQRMIREDGWKLIAYPKAGKVELFHLDKDPFEMNNLADHPDYQERKRELMRGLLELQKEMEDELELKPLFKDVI